MQQKNAGQAGFTLIELVVVIAILAILAAFALPRFAQLSEQAHNSSVDATTGAVAAGVALLKTQWISNGLSVAATDVEGFGADNMDVSADGWATDSAAADATAAASTAMDATKCENVWNGLLQANAPSVAAGAGASPDYLVSTQADPDAGESTDCVFTYQLDGAGNTIVYDADTGEVRNSL